jgi:FixJ family two-component response regulator
MVGRLGGISLPSRVCKKTVLTVVKLVLVVAPDRDLRRSVEFVLEAEQFSVESYAHLFAAVASSTATTSNCAVVDEEAILNQRSSGWQALARLDKPVVLLVDQLQTFPDLAGLQVLAKPLLGVRLIEMVGSAMARAPRGSGSTQNPVRI